MNLRLAKYGFGCSLGPLILLLLFHCPEARAAGDLELAGDALQFALPAVAGGTTVGLRDWSGSLQLAEAEGLTLGATYALKYGLNTRRPNGGHQSFPSAHSSVSFSAAEFLRKRYGWKAGVPAYAAASFVAYSRVEARQHYSYDVIGGAAIGILSSYLFTKPYKGWQISVQVGGGFYGLTLSRSF